MSFWTNKLVWITGASSGIGEAIAVQLAGKGAHLILSSRRDEPLQLLKNRLPNSDKHHVLVLDVSNPEALQTALFTNKSLIDKVSVLFNNAGISQRALTWEASAESERRLMETNFFGAVALAKSVLPAMLQRNSGRIMVMSSVTGKFGFPLRSSYAASKHALVGYFDSLRAELKDRDIFITIAFPGRIRTNISLSAVTADGSAQNEMDPGLDAGISPDFCARKIICAVESKSAEVYVGKEQALIHLKRFFPALFRWVVKRVNPK